MQLDLYGNFRTKTFADIFPTVDEFNLSATDNPLYLEELENEYSTIYYLLYSQYGNSNIANSDEFQFKMRLFSLIYQYGPAYIAKRDIQKQIRGLSLEQVKEGTLSVYNHALNPGEIGAENSTESETILNFINDQNTTRVKRSDVDALYLKYDMINNDQTNEFLKKFRKLFLTIVEPEIPLYYEGV